VALGKELLRDYINATVGFPKLAAYTKLHVKTLYQMWSERKPDCQQSIRDSCLLAVGRKCSLRTTGRPSIIYACPEQAGLRLVGITNRIGRRHRLCCFGVPSQAHLAWC
jgi:hypothetical protein